MNQRAVDGRPRVGQDAQSDVSKNYMIRQNYQAFKIVNAKHHLPAKRLDGMHEAIGSAARNGSGGARSVSDCESVRCRNAAAEDLGRSF